MVARTLMANAGTWSEHCALIGALVPGLLVPYPEVALASHRGSHNVALGLRVSAASDEGLMIRTLKSDLTRMGLQQSQQQGFKWQRRVEDVQVTVSLFSAVDKAAQDGQIQTHSHRKSGGELVAMGLYGLRFLPFDTMTVADEGPLLDPPGRAGVQRAPMQMRLCGPALFLALKAWALTQRQGTRKGEQDAYDVVWMLRALGPQTLAARFRGARLHELPFGTGALMHLSQCFESHRQAGPAGWVAESGFEGEEAAREARDAAGLVQEFVSLASQPAS